MLFQPRLLSRPHLRVQGGVAEDEQEVFKAEEVEVNHVAGGALRSHV